ncbi:hypothetical protein [Legionella rowbothamii]|uniref:hypothetical protein n=1 Tax=Legionella rowbothamii TaxID=96229 RepID=UPI003BF897D7
MDLKARDSLGQTALSLAIEAGNEEAVRELIAQGVDMEITHSYASNSPHHILFKCRLVTLLRIPWLRHGNSEDVFVDIKKSVVFETKYWLDSYRL